MKEEAFFFFIVLFVIFTKSEGEENCDLSGLRYENVTSTGVTLHWTSSNCDFDKFKFYVQHKKWLACHGHMNSNESLKIFESKKGNANEFRLENLIPYSVHNVEILAISMNRPSVRLVISVRTGPDIPDVIPGAAKPGQESTSYQRSITFYWKKNGSFCQYQNGPSDGFLVKLWGVDEWVISGKPLATAGIAENIYEYWAKDLLPYTRYRLEIFSRNQGGLINPMIPLKITARTKSGRPSYPTNVEVIPQKTSMLIKWSPPYPPTGEVEYYSFRYGYLDSDDRIFLLNGTQIHPGESKCPGGDSSHVCWAVHDLDPDINYVFEVKTKNKGVPEESEYSVRVSATLPHNKNTTVTTTKAPTLTETDSSHLQPLVDKGITEKGLGSSTLLIILCLVAAVILLMVVILVLVYRIKVNKLKMEFEQSRYSTNMSYMSPPSAVSSNTSRYFSPATQQIAEIQSRRLPEPPPVPPVLATLAVTNHEYIEPTSIQTETSQLDENEDVQYLDLKPKEDPSSPEEEGTDISGYLAPTFMPKTTTTTTTTTTTGDRNSSDSAYGSEINHVIPIPSGESYAALPSAQKEEKASKTESQPLITLKSNSGSFK